MLTILIPVDGSAYSIAAVKTAIALGKQMQSCRLHVLTVVTPLTKHMSRHLTAEKITAFHQEERDTAMHAIQPLLENSGLAWQDAWEAGAVAAIIVGYAHRNAIDHIVMGTRGLGAVSAMLLGSVANTVLELASIPVTMVKLPDATQHHTLDFLQNATVV